MDWLLDWDDGDMATKVSDDMALDSEGNLMMRMNDHVALDMDSGEVHITSSWDDEE